MGRQYYSDLTNTRLFALDCHVELCYELSPDPCGEALFAGDVTDVLTTCPFEEEAASFEVTEVGIFVYSELF